jgi:hypothetical protein
LAGASTAAAAGFGSTDRVGGRGGVLSVGMWDWLGFSWRRTARLNDCHAGVVSAAVGTGGSRNAKYQAALSYVSCMRAHGVTNYPDPAADGALHVTFQAGGKGGAPTSSGIDRMSPP